MKVLKERKDPPFKLEANTLRMEYEHAVRNYAELFKGRLSLHATALTFFLSALAAYGWLLSTAAQHGEKLTMRGRMLLEVLALILPLAAAVIHLVFIAIQVTLHTGIAIMTHQERYAQSALRGGPIDRNVSEFEIMNTAWEEALDYREITITCLQGCAFLFWLYVALKAL